jgi:hypothetical protein
MQVRSNNQIYLTDKGEVWKGRYKQFRYQSHTEKSYFGQKAHTFGATERC